MSSADATDTFRRLHESGCFVIPNAWDVGSAKQLAGLGFKALATTSSGAAWAHGRPDGGLTLDEMLTHIVDVVAATDLPVNADFMNGYADDPKEVGANVVRCVDTGVAGLSIEDSTGDPAHPVQHSVITASSLGRFLRGVVIPSDLGSSLMTAGVMGTF